MRFKFPLRIGGRKPEPMYSEGLLVYLAKFLKKKLREKPYTLLELGEEAFASMPSPNDAREAVYLLLRVWQRKGGVDIGDVGLVTWRRDMKVNIAKLAGFPSSQRRRVLEYWGIPEQKAEIEKLLREV